MKQKTSIEGAKGKFDIANVFINAIFSVIFVICSLTLLVKAFAEGEFSFSNTAIIVIMVVMGVAIIVRSVREHGRDNMTRLSNQTRFTFFALVKMITKKFPQYVVAFINMKDQKYVNRVAGKGNGDYIIIEYAKRLKEFTVRGEIVARLGGDNFIVFVYKHRIDALLEFLSGVTVNYMLNGSRQEMTVHARAGLYSLDDKDTVDDVYSLSSIALAYAKKNKTDYAWFTDEMAKELDREKEISYSFDGAIENGEFVVYYQPKVEIANNEMYASEALVRWQKGDRIISPAEFIPILEQNRLIQKLDFYVLEQVCKDMVSWKDSGIEAKPVSVNFSKHHLLNEKFAEDVIATISKYGIDKELFQVELTETADYCDIERFNDVVRQIHEAGIGTAIDDFGKGYSSPEHLKNPDIDIIKFDRSFVFGIEANAGQNKEAALVRNLIATCKELKKRVVFEGIETVEQRDIVKSMQCDYIQGYLYDKPMTESSYREKLINPIYSV